MICDIVIAADTGCFSQPRSKLGVIPGAGGTQRLPARWAKAKAMDLVLSGRMMDAAEAERSGLVSRIVLAAEVLATALRRRRNHLPDERLSAALAKECVNRAYEDPLAGVQFEPPHLPLAVRQRRPEGGHGCVSRQARSGVRTTAFR